MKIRHGESVSGTKQADSTDAKPEVSEGNRHGVRSGRSGLNEIGSKNWISWGVLFATIGAPGRTTRSMDATRIFMFSRFFSSIMSL